MSMRALKSARSGGKNWKQTNRQHFWIVTWCPFYSSWTENYASECPAIANKLTRKVNWLLTLLLDGFSEQKFSNSNNMSNAVILSHVLKYFVGNEIGFLCFILANGNRRLVSLFLFLLKLNNLFRTETALFHFDNDFERAYILCSVVAKQITNKLFVSMNLSTNSKCINLLLLLVFQQLTTIYLQEPKNYYLYSNIGMQSKTMALPDFLDYWAIRLILNLWFICPRLNGRKQSTAN